MCTRKYYDNALTGCGQRGETRVCTSSKQREELVQCQSPAYKRDKMCAQGNIIMMHSHAVTDKGETSVCTVCKKQRTVGGEIVIVLNNRERFVWSNVSMYRAH